jgi:DNA replication protein DnaD
VNHSEQKVNLKGTVLTCKRGQTLCSLDTLAKRWNCDKSKVRRFLKLLESDSMIELKSEHITTRLTICKYDTYQGERNADETQVKHKRNASETQMTPNKNDKNERMLFIVPALQEVSAYCQERNNNVDSQKFFDFYESKGWMVGKNKMKNWKAAVRTWEDKSKSNQVEEPKELLLARKLGLC